jgi:pyrimidine-nucleoside phosphorylase/thymidine phosphorylase
MRVAEILRRKRDGKELSQAEIAFMIREFSTGRIPDYQISAFLMAVYFRGMSKSEMAALTEEMQHSGSTLDLTDIPGRKVDKHSTGGIGDKTSLIVAPAVAAGGLTVPMISGRGLAHTGGTLDKLESIPGFQVSLEPDRFKALLKGIGVALSGQSDSLVPADRKLYALRDVTATVDSLPLIASSIMSKKLAEGIDGLVLDIKVGSGAFTKSLEEAQALALAMVDIGRSFGRTVTALITGMDQPLGEYVGTALEVVESIEVLKGRGPADLVSLCEELSAHCFLAGEAVSDLDQGREMFRAARASGRALNKLREIIRGQGGDALVIDDYSRLPRARSWVEIPAPAAGFVEAIDAEKMGWAVNVLGAGRENVNSVIDHAVGMRVQKKIGDSVEAGEALCTLYYNDPERMKRAREMLLGCYSFSERRPPRPTLIRKVLT